MITAAQLRQLSPRAKPALVDAIIAGWPEAEAAGVVTPRRVRHFISNICVETGGLTAVEENLNYTSGDRIRAVWPSRFKTAAAAAPYVREPEKLAIKVYGGRLGNAAAPSTDGWDFRGGGMLQTTGRDGYRALGYEADPDALRDPARSFKAAVDEWTARGCNAAADEDDAEAVRRKINGGLNGIEDCKLYLAKAKAIWPDGADVMDAAPPVAPIPMPARPTSDAAPLIQPPPIPATPKAVKASLKDAGSVTIRAADMQTKILTAGGSAVAGVSILNQLTDALRQVPPLVWGILVIVGILAVWLYTHRIVLARIEAAITGVNTEVPIVKPAPAIETHDLAHVPEMAVTASADPKVT